MSFWSKKKRLWSIEYRNALEDERPDLQVRAQRQGKGVRANSPQISVNLPSELRARFNKVLWEQELWSVSSCRRLRWKEDEESEVREEEEKNGEHTKEDAGRACPQFGQGIGFEASFGPQTRRPSFHQWPGARQTHSSFDRGRCIKKMKKKKLFARRTDSGCVWNVC